MIKLLAIYGKSLCESQLILKADDYGNNQAVYEGINELVKKGCVTDVAVMITFVGERERDLLMGAATQSPLRDEPRIGIPLHVNFVTGTPLSRPEDVSSLVDMNGVFYHPQTLMSAWREYSARVKPDEVKREIDTQIERYRRLCGYYPHALDSHNIILAVPPADEIAMQIAQELRIPIGYPKLYVDRLNPEGPFSDIPVVYPELQKRYKERGIVVADHCFPEYWNRYPTLDESVSRLTRVLSSLSSGVTELFFHPGHPDFIGQSTNPRFERGRVRDFRILTHPQVREIVGTLTLTSYKQLFNKAQGQSFSL